MPSSRQTSCASGRLAFPEKTRMPSDLTCVFTRTAPPIPADGKLPAGWRLNKQPVRSLTLGPHEGAVLVRL